MENRPFPLGVDPDPEKNKILAGKFFLLERGDDNVVSNVTANQIYNSGLLADSGETLYLLAPDRSQIDTANADGGAWPAGTGDSDDFRSMERLVESGASGR